MSFTGSFTKTNNSSAGLNYFTLADTSDYGSEPKTGFNDRYVYLYDIEGNVIDPGEQTIVLLGEKPVATITIDSVPPDGYNIEVILPVSMGGLSLGTYTKGSGDTTTTILAASIANALVPAGVTITSANNVVTITYDTKTSDYNGDDLTITSYNVTGVFSKAFFNGASTLLSKPNGTLFTIQAQIPDNSYVTIGSYTKQSSDTTAEILYNNIAAATVGNSYGYTCSGQTTYMLVTSPYYSNQNGKDFLVSFSGGSTGNSFFSGVDPENVIPNTTTNFSGGVTPGPETITGLDYFLWPYDSGDEIDINVLTEDIALTVYVVWNPIVIETDSTYTASLACVFLDYANEFKYETILDMETERQLVNNKNFFETIMLFEALVNSAQAATENSDPYSAQRCVEQLQYIQANLNVFQ